MSNRHSRNEFFVDTGLLRDHVSKLREQKKTASRLYNSVVAMKNCSDPSAAYAYNSLLRDLEKLTTYFDRMAKVLAEAGDDTVHLSHEIGEMIQDDTMQARHNIMRSYML